jgi:hypothetical protein
VRAEPAGTRKEHVMNKGKKKRPKGKKPTTTKDLTVRDPRAVSGGGGRVHYSDINFVQPTDKSSP